VNEKQARSKAQVQIALLSTAIEAYKLDMGKYPGTADNTPAAGTISAQLYTALFFEGYQASTGVVDTTGTKATKIYLPDLDPTTTKQGWVATVSNNSGNAQPPATTTIRDPWDRPYLYRKGTNAANPDFDLWSVGKDGRTKTGTAAADMRHADMRDDVKNF
jgi:type II secretory pathway pseudopilin PulG